MRLIDVDLYCATICKCNRRACDRAKCPIHNAPTAYSVDKVVEELNQRKIKLLSYAEDYEKTGDFEQAEIYSQLAIEYTTAIEIVKQGGMGKDVE